MAKGNPNPKHKFKKGNKHGKGQPKLPPEIKKMKQETKNDLIEIIQRFGNKSIEELSEIRNNKQSNVLEAIVASAFLVSVNKGEPQRAEVLFQRVLGKVPDKVINKDDRAPDISLVLVENKKGDR